jgi:tripartite ATP-independent transporter DctM subunit
MELYVFFIAFAVLLVFGMPIAAAMISSAFLYAMLKGVDLAMMGTQMFTGLNTFVLIAIPLFILTAEIMNRTSVADRIFNFCNCLVGYLPGGMSHVNIATSMVFAGKSGSAVADVGGIGRLGYRAMVNEGFDEEYSASLTIASSTIAPITPPSIPMVVYAMVSGVSVGRLFFAGIIPGVLLAFVLAVYAFFISYKRQYPYKKFSAWRILLRDILVSFIRCFFALLTPIILLGGIYLGIVTTTEAAAIAVLYAIILGLLVYRTMSLKSVIDGFSSVFKSTGAILLIIPASRAFGLVLTRENVQENVFNMVTAFAGTNPVLIAMCIILFFSLVGLFNDPNVNIMLFVPMVLPLIDLAGFDHIHMGYCIIVTAMIGNITPPVGIVTMTVCSLENLKFERICKALVPFYILLFGFVVILLIFPQIVLLLPSLIM